MSDNLINYDSTQTQEVKNCHHCPCYCGFCCRMNGMENVRENVC